MTDAPAPRASREGRGEVKARVVPYSSIVGSSVELRWIEGGPLVVQLALLNVAGDGAEHRRNSEVLAKGIADAINLVGGRFTVAILEPSVKGEEK